MQTMMPLRLCGLTVELDRTEVTGGETVSGRLLLNPTCAAAVGQEGVTLEVSGLLGSFYEVIFPGGPPANPAIRPFIITTTPVDRPMQASFASRVIVRSPLGPLTVDSTTTSLLVRPPMAPPLAVQSVTAMPNPVTGPQRQVIVTVALNAPAPPAGEPITVQVGSLIPPVTLEIPGGATAFRFTFSAPPLPQVTMVPVTVTVRGRAATVMLGIGPNGM